jgi:hypothetical protein
MGELLQVHGEASKPQSAFNFESARGARKGATEPSTIRTGPASLKHNLLLHRQKTMLQRTFSSVVG